MGGGSRDELQKDTRMPLVQFGMKTNSALPKPRDDERTHEAIVISSTSSGIEVSVNKEEKISSTNEVNYHVKRPATEVRHHLALNVLRPSPSYWNICDRGFLVGGRLPERPRHVMNVEIAGLRARFLGPTTAILARPSPRYSLLSASRCGPCLDHSRCQIWHTCKPNDMHSYCRLVLD